MTPALGEPTRDKRDAALDVAVKELRQAADHFDEIGRKAEHWCRVFGKNELAEARWAQIMRHARHRATECRRALAASDELLK